MDTKSDKSTKSFLEKEKNKAINIQDHKPKYDVSRTTLDQMEEEMLEVLSGKKKQAKIDTDAEKVAKKSAERRSDLKYNNETGAVTSVKSPEMYKKVWHHFLRDEEPDFFKYMGYGQKEIEKIGTEKFIDAMDWKYKKHTSSWRSDKVPILPCPHCHTEFGIINDALGLCFKCKPLYKVTQINSLTEIMSQQNPDLWEVAVMSFLHDDKYREQYMKKEESEYFKAMADHGLIHLDAQQYVLSAITVIGKFNETASLNHFKKQFHSMLRDADSYTKDNEEKIEKFYKDVIKDIPDKLWDIAIKDKMVTLMNQLVDILPEIKRDHPKKKEGAYNVYS